MHIINGNNEVFEITDSSVVQRFTNLRPDGEPLVISGFEMELGWRMLLRFVSMMGSWKFRNVKIIWMI